MEARKKLLFSITECVQRLEDLASTCSFDSSVHFVVLTTTEEGIDPYGQAYSWMQAKTPACKSREKRKFTTGCKKIHRYCTNNKFIEIYSIGYGRGLEIWKMTRLFDSKAYPYSISELYDDKG